MLAGSGGIVRARVSFDTGEKILFPFLQCILNVEKLIRERTSLREATVMELTF